MTNIEIHMQTYFTGEPALEDLFAEPIVQAMMRADGVIEADLRKTLANAEAKFRGHATRAAA